MREIGREWRVLDTFGAVIKRANNVRPYIYEQRPPMGAVLNRAADCRPYGFSIQLATAVGEGRVFKGNGVLANSVSLSAQA